MGDESLYLKSELYKIFKSKKSVVFIVLMLLIPIGEMVINVLDIFGDYWQYPQYYPDGITAEMIPLPALKSFLAGGSTGHIAQMLLIWILPIYLMMIYSDSYAYEVSCGYNNIVFCKEERRIIIRDKFIVSFLLPFTISVVSLLINFLLAHIFFYGGKDTLGLAQIFDSTSFPGMCLKHSNITYLVYIFIYSMLAGGCGIICTSVCYLIPNIKIAYPVAFFIWFVQILLPCSLVYVMQPFIEYGFDYTIPALGLFIIIVITMVIITYRKKVKCDEI